MVVAGPDVDDALAEEGEELAAGIRTAKVKLLRGMVGGKDCGLRMFAGFEAQVAAVEGIGFEEKLVIEGQGFRAGGILQCKWNFDVNAVLKFLDTRLTGIEVQERGVSIECDFEAGRGVGGNCRVAGGEFVEGDESVAVEFQGHDGA